MSRDLPPVTGAWRPGDPPGRRRWLPVDEPFRFEAGGELPAWELAYETWGTLNSDASNAVLVEHALTGDSHAAGEAAAGHPTAGWWDGLIGPGRALDTGELFVVVPNILGGCQGSTGPASPDPDGIPWGSRFPRIAMRDQVHAEAVLADALGIERWALVIGGSMGGMRALEWAVTLPARVESLLVVAAPAAASAEQIAWASPQLHAIRSDPAWRGGDFYDAAPGDGPHRGLGIARRIAHVTYRSELELARRFGRHRQGDDDDRFAVESYLDHHADKLVRRFDANSYLLLTESMNTHDVGRDRGGVGEALSRITARTVVAGVDSDRLYPLYQSRDLAAGILRAGDAAVISSPFGHDSFLIETPQIAALVKGLLS
ncbi:homoserine O-acetyltransferase MetX [Amycolatopsis pithecellobii]|uniref:Homoserine O-acetyltransferase n=1 Tax=Amycolatopsis pithecellobii TaxID=664692 RepID=A0A6N7Z8V3_9PSEU|nr:homoserine O-acetyltransferase [Amycolatopsis pithecellobii]MTD58210.1 homoserine O-acetyltransferase [Amycolatopsis pithecellobii]